MPREFYADTDEYGSMRHKDETCLNEIEMSDGPGICMRPKGHQVNEMTSGANPVGEFHQEAFEGWVWDNHGRVG